MTKKWKRQAAALCSILILGCLTACCREPAPSPLPFEPDLVIYAIQEEAVCQPVVKEFEERTDLLVKVEYGSTESLMRRLEASGKVPDFDVVFGAGAETLESSKSFWEPYESPELSQVLNSFRPSDCSWTGFSARPLVIMYNINVVTYRELPTGWKSLLEPRWKGRVAFLDPGASDLYLAALATAVRSCPDTPDYLADFMDNINYETLSSLSEVNSAIADGRCSLGVTLEESAQTLLASGADIDYIYPEEGTILRPDGTAIVKGCTHLDNARRFLDFTISQDTQRVLAARLKRRPIRSDVAPMAGLSPIGRLPLTALDLTELSRQKQEVLIQWNHILTAKPKGGE